MVGCYRVLVLAAAVGAAACRSPEPVKPAPIVGRFPHASPVHAGLGCATCHPTEDVLAGKPHRPGAEDHAPCDRGNCHAQAFLGAPGPMCKLCHTHVDLTMQGGTTAAAYPPDFGPHALAAEFSHALHLDGARMERTTGFHLACTDCHKAATEEQTRTAPPQTEAFVPSPNEETTLGHAACTRCHGDKVRPHLDECGRCHVARELDPPRARRRIVGDLRFHHATHASDATGKPIACVTCHTGVGEAKKTGEEPLPATEVCAGCHTSKLAPDSVAMGRCATCHARTLDTFSRIVAPRSHVARRDVPEDHTLAFRRDHAAEAANDAARCANCHGAMSGSRRDNCDECHQAMRPADHVVTWRELEHGPEAAVSAQRCTTCHGGEFCVACHSRPPRSHAFADFRNRHDQLGRENVRSCFACHQVERECAGCHAGGFRP